MSTSGEIIFLVGFMGSGKSHYGKGLSALLQVPYVDLDSRIEEQEEMSILEIFKQKGEAYFRQIETKTLHQVTREFKHLGIDNQGNLAIFGIVACGGGAPCFNDNMHWMNEHGLTVWLAPPEDVLVNRLSRENESRPLVAGLQAEELSKQVRERVAAREVYYALARIKVTDPNPTPLELLKIIGYA